MTRHTTAARRHQGPTRDADTFRSPAVADLSHLSAARL
ncbi:hypothetical protein HMPREF0675_4603 [Cutibacterium acnes SK137]|nr:hypothetical protein HMPREF0675_4603 [Cutibacterium acnes SK137]